MYEAFFGLAHPPFRITPDTDVFFTGGKRGDILDALMYAICQGEGIVKVTGEVGSGKTMLCRMLEARLPPRVETIYVANPNVPPEKILHAIAFELRLPVSINAERIEVMHALNGHLLERHSAGRQVVMFIEEAQSMQIATMEEVRLLSNLETKQHKLLQIVLFGQPELDEILEQPKIRQLRERITHSFTLMPLDAKDVGDYILFRLRAAGYRGPDLFSRRVVNHIARASGGLTRRINILSDKTLLAAFADGTRNVSLKHVKTAVRDSVFSPSTSGRFSASPLACTIGGVVLGAVLGVAVVTAYFSMPPAATVLPSVLPSPAKPFKIKDKPIDLSIVPPPAPVRPAAQSDPSVSSHPEERTVPGGMPPQGSVSAPVEPVIEPAALAEVRPAAGAHPDPRPESRPDEGAKPPATPTATADWVARRLTATRQWLAETPKDRYSIQLLITQNRGNLEKFLSSQQTQLEIDKVFVYPTLAGKRPCLAVVYGAYASRAEAVAEMERLPAFLKSNQPRYRTVGSIRAEVASRAR